MEDIVIVSASRTPIGKFLGNLSKYKVPQLGAYTVKETIRRVGLENGVDTVIMGNVLGAGVGQNPARQVAFFAELPSSVRSYTVNRVCGSAMMAVILGVEAIMNKQNKSEIVVAGGMESMSKAPHLVTNMRTGYKFGDNKMRDSMITDGLWDYYNDLHMGSIAEETAKKYKITREEQDKFAAESQKRAAEAKKNGSFEKEIVGFEELNYDEGIREGVTLEKLSGLDPVFNGTITAGNASQLSDGAASLLLMSAKKAKKLKLKPMARIIGYADYSCDPMWYTTAPAFAIKNFLEKTGSKLEEYDLIELNEAFAVQSLSVFKELPSLDPAKVNVNGGAIALGHPIGATGARILVTLIYALMAKGLKKGIASLCIGGGEALAMGVEIL